MKIMGYETMGEPSSPTDVYMCGKHNYLESLCGEWIPRSKYNDREEWFPYSPNDMPKMIFHKSHVNEITKEYIPGYTEEILHPPVYFDTNGNRLPGNRINPPQKIGHAPYELDSFNFYNGGTFSGVVVPIIIIFSLIFTFVFNGGYIIWFLTIPGLLLSYYHGKRAVRRFLEPPRVNYDVEDLGCYDDNLIIPYKKED